MLGMGTRVAASENSVLCPRGDAPSSEPTLSKRQYMMGGARAKPCWFVGSWVRWCWCWCVQSLHPLGRSTVSSGPPFRASLSFITRRDGWERGGEASGRASSVPRLGFRVWNNTSIVARRVSLSRETAVGLPPKPLGAHAKVRCQKLSCSSPLWCALLLCFRGLGGSRVS